MKLGASRLIGALFLAAMICPAADPIESWFTEEEPIENPDGLTLTISTGKKQFAIGEPIPIVLKYVNETDLPYELRQNGIKPPVRDSRLEFQVTKPGGGYGDPRKRWVNLEKFTYYIPFEGFAKLGEHDQSCFLNEWIRFDRPGAYSVRLQSRCVYEPLAKNRLRSVRLTSNTITIEVAPPESGELDGLLEKAASDLDVPDNVRAIRFLNTKASRTMLLDWLLHDPDLRQDAAIGLVGDRDRRAVRDLLVESLAKPDLEPPPELLHTLGMVVTDEPVKFPGWVVSGDHDLAKRPRRMLVSNALDTIREQVEEQDLDVTLANVVSALGRDTIWGLEHAWDKIRCEALSPQLATWANPSERQYGNHYLPTWAAIRWLEIDPEGAREFILAKLKEPAPLLSEKALGALPDEELPELDEILLENLNVPGRDYDRVMFAIERYASSAILDEMVALYLPKEGRWACALQDSMLRYWIKHDRKAGIEAAFRAQTYREKGEHSRCYASNLSRVLEPIYDEKIEERLLRELRKEEDPDVILNITGILLRQGSPRVVDVVIDRFATVDPADESLVPRTSTTWAKARIYMLFQFAKRELTPAQLERIRSFLNTKEELDHALVREP